MIINRKSVGGITPTGTVSITQNGTHDVTSYASANVNVSGNNPLLYASHLLRTFYQATLPSNFEITVGSNCTSLGSSYNGSFERANIGSVYEENSKLTINGTDAITSFAYVFNNWGYFDSNPPYNRKSGFCSIEFNFSTRNVTDWNNMCNSSPIIKTFVNPLDFTSATNVANLFRGCGSVTSSGSIGDGLTNIQVVENTIPISISFFDCNALSNASVISIANGLNETITGQTLTLHSTPKAYCGTVMGTVTLDQTSTYHIFTADASGATTLEEFITVTKGWTLA